MQTNEESTGEAIKPDTTNRPWGFFRTFTLNQPSTVKILHVNAGESLSLQYHMHRREFWRVLKGEPKIVIDKKEYSAKEGDEFTVPEKAEHRISATDHDVEILEVSLGEFDENDITRLDDRYGRS